MLSNCGAGENSWESLGLQGDQTIQSLRIDLEYSLEGLMLKSKLQYFVHLTWKVDSLKKDCNARKDWGQEEKRVTENNMVGWYQWLNGHDFEQNTGDTEGQGSLVCCRPQGFKESQLSDWTKTTTTYSNGTDYLQVGNFEQTLYQNILRLENISPPRSRMPYLLTDTKLQRGHHTCFLNVLSQANTHHELCFTLWQSVCNKMDLL